MTKLRKLISIVVPVYQEEEVIAAFYRNLTAVLEESPDYAYEVIFVDDGSTDGTAKIIGNMVEAGEAANCKFKLISFSRNFGHQYALTCGFDHAQGDAVITMDSDLQHPPELIPRLIEFWERGYDIVYTVRTAPQAGRIKNITSRLFYTLVNLLSEIPINQDAADFRLVSRRVAAVFQKDIRERDRFLRGLTSWVGFRSIAVDYTPQPRAAGKSKYSFKKMWRLATSGLLSFSTIPLKLGIYLGVAMGTVSLAYGAYALIMYFLTDRAVTGWTSLVIFISAISSLLFVLLGLIGVYIGRIFEEIKHRPLYIIRDITSFPDAAAPASLSSSGGAEESACREARGSS